MYSLTFPLHFLSNLLLSLRALRFRPGLARGCDEHSGWPRNSLSCESAWIAHSPLLPAFAPACLFACLFALLICR
jgi:hypothetical protein